MKGGRREGCCIRNRLHRGGRSIFHDPNAHFAGRLARCKSELGVVEEEVPTIPERRSQAGIVLTMIARQTSPFSSAHKDGHRHRGVGRDLRAQSVAVIDFDRK